MAVGQEQHKQLSVLVAALLSDLCRNGMLDDTLVVVTSDFDRTSRYNSSGGTDHSVVGSMALFGAVNGGIYKPDPTKNGRLDYVPWTAEGAPDFTRDVRPEDLTDRVLTRAHVWAEVLRWLDPTVGASFFNTVPAGFFGTHEVGYATS